MGCVEWNQCTLDLVKPVDNTARTHGTRLCCTPGKLLYRQTPANIERRGAACELRAAAFRVLLPGLSLRQQQVRLYPVHHHTSAVFHLLGTQWHTVCTLLQAIVFLALSLIATLTAT